VEPGEPAKRGTLEIISSYSRAQALEDGELVAADPKLADEAGIRWPVALTRALWAEAVEVNARDREYGQDVTGRLWDVLWLFAVAVRTRRFAEDTFVYAVMVQKGRQLERVRIKAHVGPGDKGEPVITLMLPDED
jgi:hypothetical protein